MSETHTALEETPRKEARATTLETKRSNQRDQPATANRRWLGLGALALFSFLLTLDDTALSVALPSIGRDLGLGLSGLEWIVNAYTLALAALLLAGGRLADTLP